MLTLKRDAALRRGRGRLQGACVRVVAVGARILGEDEVARVGRCAGSERPAGHAHEVEPARVRVSAGECKRQSVASVARHAWPWRRRRAVRAVRTVENGAMGSKTWEVWKRRSSKNAGKSAL